MAHHRTAAALVLAILASSAAPAAAQPGREMLDPRLGKRLTELTFTLRAYCDREVKDQGADIHMARYRTQLSLPVYQDDQQEWMMTARYGAWDTDTSAILPDTGQTFPSCLQDVRLGTSYRRRMDNGWIWGGGVRVGSPSDKPFASGQEVALDGHAFLRIPHGKRNAWLAMVSVSNTREFARCVPLPGVAYNCVPTDRLNLVVGVPFSSVRWEPIERLTLSARYMLLRNIHARVGYEVTERCEVYGLFEWDHEAYLRHDRQQRGDRLFFYEKRIGGGVEFGLTETMTLDLSAGWAFDRRFFEGEDYDDRGDNNLVLQDGIYVAAAFRIRF
jgi:hypothetical protein